MPSQSRAQQQPGPISNERIFLNMKGIFISYRREDSAGYAGRLYDRLAAHFGADRVFMDVEGIEPGVDFVDAIERAVASCEVLIVIIGNEWLAANSAGKRRLDDPRTSCASKRRLRSPAAFESSRCCGRCGDAAGEDLPADLTAARRRQAWSSATSNGRRDERRIDSHPRKDPQRQEGAKRRCCGGTRTSVHSARRAEPGVSTRQSAVRGPVSTVGMRGWAPRR
jgi:hypothetical protein